MQLNLSADAVRSLIKMDETFELQLATGVMANLTRHLTKTIADKTEDHVNASIKQHVNLEFHNLVRKKMVSPDRFSSVSLNPEFKKQIEDAMLNAVQLELSAIRLKVEETARLKMKEFEDRIDVMVTARVREGLDAEFARQVNAKITAILQEAANKT